MLVDWQAVLVGTTCTFEIETVEALTVSWRRKQSKRLWSLIVLKTKTCPSVAKPKRFLDVIASISCTVCFVLFDAKRVASNGKRGRAG
eukprot:911967-Amphidinium_carterae.1